ncbi:MAG: hypothetical protein E4H07_09680 [Nitrosomonadales bacterium]|nr:MAG: hypothetical protein E4H07_09680 [Nitrosomonadales bacterium]
MQKWVISWIGWHDYEMHMETVSILSSENCEISVLKIALEKMGFTINNNVDRSVEGLKDFAFDCEGMIGAIRVD